MNDRTRQKSEVYWGRRAVVTLFQKFNCAEATMQACQDMIDRKEDAVLKSIAGLVGGVVCQGSTCGVVSGGASCIALMHDEALQHNGRVSEAAVVSLASDYVKWFGNTYGTTYCSERTGVDFRTLGGQLSYMIPGHRMVRCMAHINGAMKYLYQVQQANLPSVESLNEIPAEPVHCAQAVLEGVRANTGIGDPVLERISIALDGGIGLQGGACGALAGAILAINLLLGVNLREVSLPRAYYHFFKGLTYLRSDKSENTPDPYNVGKIIVNSFRDVAGSIDCHEITDREFLNWEDFQSYITSSSECRKLIDLSINEATSAILSYGEPQ